MIVRGGGSVGQGANIKRAYNKGEMARRYRGQTKDQVEGEQG